MRVTLLIAVIALLGCKREEPKGPPPAGSAPAPAAVVAAVHDAGSQVPKSTAVSGCAGLKACGAALGASQVPMGSKLGGVMVSEAEQGPEARCNEIIVMRIGGLQDELYKLPPPCQIDLEKLIAEAGLPKRQPEPAITPCGRLRQCGQALNASSLPIALASMGSDLVELAVRARDPFDISCARSLRALEKSVGEVKGADGAPLTAAALPVACR